MKKLLVSLFTVLNIICVPLTAKADNATWRHDLAVCGYPTDKEMDSDPTGSKNDIYSARMSKAVACATKKETGIVYHPGVIYTTSSRYIGNGVSLVCRVQTSDSYSLMNCRNERL